jgi:allantoin racemase
MARRIDFLNPFGTPRYDAIVAETLAPYAAPGTELRISHLENCPENIDYYYMKHLVETAVYQHVMKCEQEGFDAVVVGCCYDPGVTVARELVDIPVIGPLEATIAWSRYFGHDFTVMTDHQKAVPWLVDLVRLYGATTRCRSVRCIDWWVTEMVKDPLSVARETVARAEQAMKEDRSEVVVLGCTIIAACLERAIRQGAPYGRLPILNTNVAALKTAEGLADLYKMGRYSISRAGYYAKPQDHNRAEFDAVQRWVGEGRGR